MNKIFKLAWRNIWRNRRRSIITISAISFAILMVAVTRSLQYGTYDLIESLAVQLYNGEIQLHRKGFQDEQTLTLFLNENEKNWRQIIENVRGFNAFSRRITSFGLVSSDSASTGALIVGVEPDKETAITKFTRMVVAGKRLNPDGEKRILIGATMAKNLLVGVSDTVVVITQGYRNQLGADRYVVNGLVSVGQADLDRALMIMSLSDAQELFSLEDGITQVVFSTVDFRRSDKFTKSLSKHFDDARYEILSWEEMMPELKQIILLDNVSGAIYLAFLLIVVGFEIFNTTMMNVMERVREFGILQAIGMKPKQLSGLILLESSFKITISLMVGLLISFVVVSILIRYPIPLSDEIVEAYASYGFVIENLQFSGKAKVYLEPFFSIAIIAVLALIYPLYKTVKLTPIEAFRKV
ncbi:MAG: ABC transporter permease [bacterium]